MARSGGTAEGDGAIRRALRVLGMGRLRRWAGEVMAGTLHPLRRRRARRALRASSFDSYLFICHGNIYRSPFAHYLFEARLPPPSGREIEVSSAGFVGPGRSSPPKALALAAQSGVDLTPHRSRAIAYDRIGDRTLVVVMDPRQERAIRQRTRRGHVLVLGDLDPAPVTSRTIVDPWKEEDGVLRASYARVERCIDVLAEEVKGEV